MTFVNWLALFFVFFFFPVLVSPTPPAGPRAHLRLPICVTDFLQKNLMASLSDRFNP